ncbi:MAG: BREX-6 system adenine-specific DNA-methyltransferase PglX, partial [Cyanobacteria bacterium P01_E01_bin.43]
MPYLTPDAKNQLSRTIRSLRNRLLTDLHNAAESTYRLSITKLDKAGLAEAPREQRRRLEDWLDEQVRAEVTHLTLKGDKLDKAKGEIRDRTLRNAIKLAAATLLNRLIVIRQMEALGLLRNKVVTGGWSSPAYREFRDFAPDLCKDDTEGYGFLLSLLYDELALDLPGLFGKVGLTELFPIPASTLRAVVEALDALDSDTWRDDTTLGWVYQYWNDPEREALDDKLNGGGKVEPHEIASKTQMFTERYMVEWLLHNSLGQQWLAICQHNGWTPDVVVDGTLDRLEACRQDWREKRDRGEVALDALMPIESEQEERWKYWVKQPPLTPLSGGVPAGRGESTEADLAATTHPNPSQEGKSIRHLKILDPACGSGHFLIIAFGLLFAFYQEEARHRGETWTDRDIVEAILTHNLHGLDLDPRAVQIAAAALYLKAKALCPQAELKVLNLVASNLNLAALPEDDPALVELRQEVTASTGIPEELTNQIVQGLKGADAWGSLLKVDDEVDRAIAEYEQQLYKQGELFAADGAGGQGIVGENALAPTDDKTTRDVLIEKLERFLTLRTRGDDLGLRLRGEQLAAGVRFLRLVREGAYDLVIGNPPYQGTSKMKDAKYVAKHYKRAKADLYAAFLQRGLELAKPGGLSALLTMRNWMFI